MNAFLKMAIALIMLMGLEMSPALASAEVVPDYQQIPVCSEDPDGCQDMLDEYVSLHGQLPENDSDGSSYQPIPVCSEDPDGCQDMLDEYIIQYGQLLEEEPTPEAAMSAAEIEVTPGAPPTAEVQETINGYLAELQAIAHYVCNEEHTQNQIWQGINQRGQTSEEIFTRFEGVDQATLDQKGIDLRAWGDVVADLTAYLEEQAEAGVAVYSRAPTLLELAEQYPGCATGERFL